MKNLVLCLALAFGSLTATAADLSNGADNFYKSNKVTAQQVTFKNQYQMKVVGNLYIPKGMKNSGNPAIIVGHPMGAVKEQSAICMHRSSPNRDS
jgi:hypothetical protein